MIERSHLAILHALDEQGSLSAAANALCLTQSALSHAIKKLEDKTGVKLWLKDGRQIRLTEAGRHVLAEAKRLLPQLERLDESLLQFASGEKGCLRLGMECHPCYQWMLKIVERFLRTHPGVDIDVKQRFQFGGMAALFNHDIDLLITPDPLHKKGVTFFPVFNYHQVLVVSQSHRLAKHAFVSPADLAQETLFTYPVETDRLDIFTDFLRPVQQHPRHHKTLEATELMLELVAAQRGVAALPDWLAQHYQLQHAIAAVPLGKHGIRKTLYLGVRNSEATQSAAHDFIRLAKTATEGRGYQGDERK